MADYNCLFKDERFEFCELNGRFYKVDLDKKLVDEVEFDELLVDYVVRNGSKIVKNFLMIYVRLCMNMIGIDTDYIKSTKDLDFLVENYFKEGLTLDES